ncbi:MAG: hypothetical protein ACP5K5_02120 [Candidatus Micrarchaeia archaeon]
MKRAILLQIGDITETKCSILEEFAESKTSTGFNVQVYASLERAVWRSKGKAKGITVKFNIPRNCKTFETKSMFFIELAVQHANQPMESPRL